MTLALTPEFWAKEIRAAHKLTKEQLRIFESQVNRYCTPFHKGTGEVKAYDPENHAYQYITGMVPQMVYQNPRIRVESGKAGLGSWIAIMYKHLLNKRTREIDFEGTMIDLAHDVLFQYAVAMVTTEVDYRYPVKGGYARNPIIVRIPQEDFLIDPLAYRRKDARWMGHIWRVDKDDLIERAEREDGWRMSAIKALPVDRTTDRATGLEREEVECVDIHIPNLYVDDDVGPDDGFCGTELTFAWTGQDIGEIIRSPQPAFAPHTGRYKVCDISYVPNSPFGLSPLVAVEGQVRELNKLVKRQIAMALRYKKLALVEDGDSGFAQKLVDAENDLVLPVRSLDQNKAQTVELGGITDQIMAQIAEARSRLDRNASTSDSQRGKVNEDATATAEAIADANADIRSDMIVNRFHRFACDLVNDIAHNYWHNEEARSYLGAEFLMDIGMPKEVIEMNQLPGFEYSGGDSQFEAYKGVAFSDLNVAFEPLSMGRTTENVAQRRALEAMSFTGQLMQLAGMNPMNDWTPLANMIGNALNIPDYGEMSGIANMQGLAAVQQIQQPQQGATGMPGNEAGAAARMVG